MARTIFLKKYENAEIAAATSNKVGILDKDKVEWAPFNMIRCYNLSANDIELRFEGWSGKAVLVPAGAALELDWEEGLNFYNLFIYNRSSLTAIPAGKVITEISRIVQW
jgi:hypothetical protein